MCVAVQAQARACVYVCFHRQQQIKPHLLQVQSLSRSTVKECHNGWREEEEEEEEGILQGEELRRRRRMLLPLRAFVKITQVSTEIVGQHQRLLKL